MLLAEYTDHDALGLAALVRAREVSPHELLDAALKACEAREELNAVPHVLEEQARAAIDAGLPEGPFTGVPFALKDLWTAWAGTPTTNGSRLFADAVSNHDDELVRRYRAAGLVLFAKTSTAELGLMPSTEPALYGPVLNPHDQSRSAGGSSGGAAAAVASGILPMAHASDGGGSIRIPAAWCGLFGLKPTRARVP